MKIRHAAPLAALAVVAAGALAPASAAPGKTITKSYDMQQAPAACQPEGGELTYHRETFTATTKGTLTAKIEGFMGDWDLGLRNADDAEVAAGGGSSTGPDLVKVGPTEVLIYKITKPGKYTVTSCNYLGSPNAKGSYTFKPTK